MKRVFQDLNSYVPLLPTGALVQPLPPSEARWAAKDEVEPPISVRPEELNLCDCERALGTPHGLSCEKEGWFITGFERKGSWVRTLLWVRAVCQHWQPQASHAR